jgi:glycosyltransferase involved in cell wall biosynthesis
MQLIERLHRTSAVAIPSFVESYSMSLAEAMLVGVPVVVAHAGAMPEMVQDGVSGLVFSPGDETMCAWQLERIFRDPALASRLSYSARHIGLQRNDAAAVVGHQLDIYREVLSRSRAHVSVSVTTSSDVPTGIA